MADLRPDHPVEIRDDGLTSGSIHVYDDHWHRYSNGAHGCSTLDLLAELKGDLGAATDYARKWLTENPWTGTWEGISTEASRRKAELVAERARLFLQRKIAIADTPAEMYLIGRGIDVLATRGDLLGYMPVRAGAIIPHG
jgi:hypothetical protein